MPINNAVNASTAGFQSLTSGGVWNGRTLTAGTGISITNGDGTAGNPTISASGSIGGLGTAIVYDDFLGNVVTSAGLGNSNLSTFGVAGTFSAGTSPNTNPGILTMVSGANSPGVTTSNFTPGGGQIICQWIVQLPTLSTVTNRYNAFIGIYNSAIGCWFQYSDNVNSGNWQIICSGAATTTVNTTTAADTNYHNFKVIINAANTQANFYIDGVEVSGSPIATNLPNGNTQATAYIFRVAGTGGTMNVDLLNLQINLTSARPG